MALPATEDFAGSAAPLGGSWTQMRSTATLDKNGSGAGVSTGGYGFAIWTGDAFNNDHYSQLVIASAFSSNWVYVIVRGQQPGDGTNDCYAFYTDGLSGSGNTGIAEFTDGAETELASFAITVAVSDVLKCVVTGTSIECFKNGGSVGSTTDGTITSGSPGAGAFGTSVTIDDWIGDNNTPFALTPVGIIGTRRPMLKMKGPRDRRGFLKQRVWDYSPPGFTEFPFSADGTLAAGDLVGTLSFQPRILLVGGITPTGTLSKQTSSLITGVLTFVGAINYQVRISFAGEITPAAIVTFLKVTLRDFAGAFTPSGTLLVQAQKVFSGTLTMAGTLARQTNKLFAGTIAPAGALIKQTRIIFAGGITPAAIVAFLKVALRAFTGNITPTGSETNTYIPFSGGGGGGDEETRSRRWRWFF